MTASWRLDAEMGEPVTLTVYSVRVGPRWWRHPRAWRAMRRLQRDAAAARAAMTPAERAIVDDVERRLDRAILFGE